MKRLLVLILLFLSACRCYKVNVNPNTPYIGGYGGLEVQNASETSITVLNSGEFSLINNTFIIEEVNTMHTLSAKPMRYEVLPGIIDNCRTHFAENESGEQVVLNLTKPIPSRFDICYSYGTLVYIETCMNAQVDSEDEVCDPNGEPTVFNSRGSLIVRASQSTNQTHHILSIGFNKTGNVFSPQSGCRSSEGTIFIEIFSQSTGTIFCPDINGTSGTIDIDTTLHCHIPVRPEIDYIAPIRINASYMVEQTISCNPQGCNNV